MNSRKSFLDEPGNIRATPGTREWAVGVIRKIRAELQQVDSEVRHIKSLIKLAKEKEAFRVLGYMSFDTMLVKECEIDGGLASAISEAEDGETVGAVLGKHGQYGRGRPKPDRGVNHTSKRGSGNKDYTLARLARDHADILQQYEAGEFPSVRQAAIAAGIVKVPTTLELLMRAWKKATAKEKKAFLEQIKQ